jgi:hypothetical protein
MSTAAGDCARTGGAAGDWVAWCLGVKLVMVFRLYLAHLCHCPSESQRWDRTRCTVFCLQNGSLIRPASTRFFIGLQSHACSNSQLCRVRPTVDLVA